MKLHYEINDDCVVKDFLKEVGLSHHLLKQIRRLDNIVINGEKGKNYFSLHKGDILELEFSEEMNDEIISSEGNIDIVYEDEYFIVIDKPSYISSMPSKKHQTDNILSFVKWYFEKNNIRCNMHLVNRLDYQTSGLIIIAKSGIIHYEFSKQNILKKYLCVVRGNMDKEKGEIELPISRFPAPEIKRYIDLENGKYAKTLYKVLGENKDRSLIEVELVTGRTHQIRLHFSYLGYPLIGDKLYNDDIDCNDKELLLHSYYLKFIHPITGKTIELKKYPKWIDEWRNVCQEL